MLNELMIVERGARQAGISMPQRHPDVKDAGRMPTLKVQLDKNGNVDSVGPIPYNATPWKLSDGQHNSFPFVKPKNPLWIIPNKCNLRSTIFDKKKTSYERRTFCLELSRDATFNDGAFKDWPGRGLLARLQERRKQLSALDGTDAAVVTTTIDRFLHVCDPNVGGGSRRLLTDVANTLIENLGQTAQDDWLNIAIALLIGKEDRNRSEWVCAGALIFEAAGYPYSITDPKMIEFVSHTLADFDTQDARGKYNGICALTGERARLQSGNFPQPNLKVLGQTWLFSKNREIPANDRYGRFAADAMCVGSGTVMRLGGALRALADPDRKNKTWRAIPGERPKQSDLLLAFVDEVLDTPVADMLAEEDFTEEEGDSASDADNSVAAFEKRTERLIEVLRANASTDFSKTLVRLIIIRKVDPANRKVVYAGSPTVAGLYKAATTWLKGERNVPPWVALPVLRKSENKPRAMSPPHIAPLGLIAFSKKVFIRGGTDSQEVLGLPASETLRFLLDPTEKGNYSARYRAERVLRFVFTRRSVLVAGVGHVQHTPECWDRRFKVIKKFDLREALRTITVLGVLLHKLDRDKEVYMNDTAFNLGQLLAAADIVHAGYCADVRGGAVPPSLLGNQVFVMAQSLPAKALALLCRRWKPYDGWAKKASRDRKKSDGLIASKNKNDQQRGWDIKKALRSAREMGPLAEQLAGTVDDCRVDDIFRAELLLGYISGLPKKQDEDADVQDHVLDREKED